MLNYIKAELYRNFNRALFWVFTGITAGLALLINIILKMNHVPGMGLTSLVEGTVYMLTAPVFLAITFVDMITAEEQKNLTVRNVVSFGMTRSKLILSKLSASIILAFISALMILIVFYGSGTILFGLGKDFPGHIQTNLIKMLVSIPLWIAAIAIGTFLSLVFSNNTIFAFVYVGVFLVTANVIKLLAVLVSSKFMNVYNILITPQLQKLGSSAVTSHDLTFAVLSGVIYTIIFTILSILYFERKEVK